MKNTFYSTAQVAELAGCSRIYVLKSIERKNLLAFRTGRGRTSPYVILAEDAARFISEFRIRKTIRENSRFNP